MTKQHDQKMSIAKSDSETIERFGKNSTVLFALAMLLIATLACGLSGRDEPIQIRIHNETELLVEDFWLGSSNSGRHHFRDIKPGEQTNYRGMDTHTSQYAQSSAYIDGTTFAHIAIPIEEALAPGKYTFVLRLDNSEPTVIIQSDN